MKAKTAFTKKDLAVVLVCVAFVLVNIAAVGKSGRARSKQLVCLANLRQLTNAWLAFAKDNGGKLVGGHVPYHGLETDWVRAPQDEHGNYMGNSPTCNIEHKKLGIERGALFAYLKNTNIYHCPADDRYIRPSSPGYKCPQGGFRSYSIPRGLNDPGYGSYTITRYSQIKNPAEKYAFVEESDSRGYNRGSWVLEKVNNPYSWEWTDPVAAWHDGHGALGFADGHAEMHKWLDQRTIEISTVEDWELLRMMRRQPQNPDIVYMKQHFPHLGVDD